MSAQPKPNCVSEAKPDAWFHSLEFDAQSRRALAQRRASFRRTSCGGEEIGDPEDFSSEERRRQERRNRYFSRSDDAKRRRGDPRNALPSEDDLQVLADTFGATPEALAQAVALKKRRLRAKAKAQVLCRLLGKRQNCSLNEEHRFFNAYRCRNRYCPSCGPAWFRATFKELMFLEPVVERLLREGRVRGRRMVVAKIDFTVPNTGEMPGPKFVRKFHADMRRFWRALERRLGISRKEYGRGGCDEFGGSNTNLHRHCVYVGPWLPQTKEGKELSALWSEIRGERSFVSIKWAKSFSAALAHALKYPAKFLSGSIPERLAELEATFHGTRRFGMGGVFHGLKSVREPGEDSPIGECPICGARLYEVLEGWVARFQLEKEGRRPVEDVCREVGRQRIFADRRRL